MAIVAAHAALLIALFLSGGADVVMDAAGYWDLGKLCADGDFLWEQDPIAYRTPGYPTFLGLVQRIAGRHAWWTAVLVQHLLLVLTAAIAARIVWRITDSESVAIVGYILAAAGMVRTWFAQTLLTETLFVFLITLHFACLLSCLKDTNAKKCALTGAVLGLAILVRPVVQLWWLPAFGLLAFCGTGRSLTTRIRSSVVGVVVMSAVVLPWFLRNQLVFGEPFLTEFLGRNIWIVTFQDGSGAGLNIPQTESGRELLTATGWEKSSARLRETWTVSNRLAQTGLPDDDVDRLMKRVCVDAIFDDLPKFSMAAIRRLVNFWRCVPDPYPYISDPTVSPPAGQDTWRNSTLSDWETALYDWAPQRSLRWNELVALLVLLGTLVMIADRHTRSYGLLLLLFFGMVSGLTALVEIPNVRYRMVLEPLMVVAVCCGAARLRCRDVHPSEGDGKAIVRRRNV